MTDFDAIIFDLDGTLVDSLPGIEHSVRAAMEETCPGATLDSLRRHIGPPIGEVFRRATGINDREKIDAFVAAFRRNYDGEGWLRTVAFDGVAEVLSRLARHDVRLFVLTNKPAPATERILVRLKLRGYFERVVAPELHGPTARTKADEAVSLVEIAELCPAKTLLVGDSRDDAEAARRCGFAFAAAQFGYGDAALNPEAAADFILNRFTDLSQTIQLQAI